MNPFGISPKSWTLLCNLLQERGLAQHTVIFGSRAKGNYEHGSDIDLAVLKPGFTAHDAFRLRVTLNQETPTPYYYDVLAFATLTNDALMQEIQRYGKPIVSVA